MKKKTTNRFKVSLIIATYNWPEALELCLLSVLQQTVLPDEIIIADDGSTNQTKKLIDKFIKKTPLSIKHIWHEDKGFRKCIILNKSIKETRNSYIVQIDGDVILHKNFIEDHAYFSKPKTFIKAYRSNLTEQKTKGLMNTKKVALSWHNRGVKNKENSFRLPFYSKIFKPKEVLSSEGITGSNTAYWKEDAFAVNGYNNNLTGWGAEDKEFAQRLVNYGIKKRRLKFVAIQFHLYHKEADKKNHREQIEEVIKLINNKTYFCNNGIK